MATAASASQADSSKAPAKSGTVGDAQVTHANADGPLSAAPDDKTVEAQNKAAAGTDAAKEGAERNGEAAEADRLQAERPVDARVLTMSKQIQAMRANNGDDVVDAAMKHAAAARKAAGTARADAPAGARADATPASKTAR